MAISCCPPPSPTIWPQRRSSRSTPRTPPRARPPTPSAGSIEALLSIGGDRTVHSFHKELGTILWDHCGMERTQAGLTDAIERVRELKAQFWRSVAVTGENTELNQTLERAGRVADFFELAELMCIDALHREESCGCHFRVESQTADGEARRDDDGSPTSPPGNSRRGPPSGAAPGRPRISQRRDETAELQMNLTLRIWRQKRRVTGVRWSYWVRDISPDMSFLEVLDVLNEQLTRAGEDPIAFDSDCREGICGACGLVINGVAHGPQALITTCQLYMRSFADGDVIDVEPWRAAPFPVIKDLVVDRSGIRPDHRRRRIHHRTNGRRSRRAGRAGAQDACRSRVRRSDLHRLRRLRCGVPQRSAALFLGAKITHLGDLPQGQAERRNRALAMIDQHDAEGFGGCTQIGECTAVCPKGYSTRRDSRYHRDVLSALIHRED